MINVFNMQQQLHSIVEELSGIHKDFEILNYLHIIMQTKDRSKIDDWKTFDKIIQQLL